MTMHCTLITVHFQQRRQPEQQLSRSTLGLLHLVLLYPSSTLAADSPKLASMCPTTESRSLDVLSYNCCHSTAPSRHAFLVEGSTSLPLSPAAASAQPGDMAVSREVSVGCIHILAADTVPCMNCPLAAQTTTAACNKRASTNKDARSI